MPLRWLNERPEIAAHDIVTRAMHRTKVDEFGGVAWIEPLEVLTRSLQREARLPGAGRRAARADLVDLLCSRVTTASTDHERGTAPMALPHHPSRPIVVTGLDPADMTAMETALGTRPGRGESLLDTTFASLHHDIRWHVPSFAEWLAEVDLSSVLADVRDRSRATADEALEVIAAVQLLERLPEVRRVMPDALIVEVSGDPAVAAAHLADASIAARRRDSADVDAAKVQRYWQWRTGLMAERRSDAETIGGPTLTVTHDELTSAPAVVAETIRAAVGLNQA